MNIKQATEFAKDFIKNNPEFEDEVEGLHQLMLDEIEAGESAPNEISLFIGGCEDLLIKD